MGHGDLSVVGAVVVTTPIQEVLTSLLLPHRAQRPWSLQLDGSTRAFDGRSTSSGSIQALLASATQAVRRASLGRSFKNGSASTIGSIDFGSLRTVEGSVVRWSRQQEISQPEQSGRDLPQSHGIVCVQRVGRHAEAAAIGSYRLVVVLEVLSSHALHKG